MRVSWALAVVSLAALPLLGGYAARDSWIAVAGHATGLASRHFETTVYLTDTSRATNDVTVSFYPAGRPSTTPRTVKLQLGPNQSGAIGVGPQLVAGSSGIGALHIQSTGGLLAEARLYSRLENEPSSTEVGAVLNAIPSQFSIGTADSTLLHVPAGTRYKLYAVETSGFPLYFSIAAGMSGPERRLYIAAHEQRSWDLAQLFPAAPSAALTITGINGSGKIIVLGTAIAERSQDFDVYEMLLPTRARHRMRWPEITMYVLVAAAIVLTAVYRLKKPATG